jgi:hypothetical protein
LFSSKPGLFTTILAILLASIGLVDALTGIADAFGIPGIVIIIITLGVATLCFVILRPVLVKNTRGVTMLNAITTLGLVDIENREHAERHVPHPAIYNFAEREIVITGVTAHTTFKQHLDVIHNALEKRNADGTPACHIYIMILHPYSSDVPRQQQKDKINVIDEIYNTIGIIKDNELNKRPNFHIRFMDHMPPFTAVMIDGDISPTGTIPSDYTGQIRVQPQTEHSTHI